MAEEFEKQAETAEQAPTVEAQVRERLAGLLRTGQIREEEANKVEQILSTAGAQAALEELQHLGNPTTETN